jgi:hypothetical protein
MQKPVDCEQILEIKDKTSVTIIQEFMKDGVKMQYNSLGQTKGRYNANHTETVDIVQKMDGTNEWESRSIDVTQNGETILISGKGVGRMNTFQGEYTFMTQTKELAWLNNTTAYAEGSVDMVSNVANIKVYAVKPTAQVAAPM